MIQEIKMPSAGQTTDEATIASVKVKAGDIIKRGDILLEAETDKAVLPVESFAAGTVLAVLVKEGDTVTKGTVLVAVGNPGETYTAGTAAQTPAAEVKPAESPAAAPAAAAAPSVGTPIKMPNAGQTTDEATIASVKVKAGDTVKRGDVLFEAETDKAVLPVECFTAGQIFDVLVKEGDTVKAGDIIAVVGKPEDAAKYTRGGGNAAAPAAVTAAPAAAPTVTEKAEPDDDYMPIIKGWKPSRQAAPAAAAAAPVKISHPVYPAMPGAKALAKEKGIDIRDVVASNGQFIKKADVLAYNPVQAPAEAEEETEYTVQKMSRMRQIISKRMMESKTTIPDWQATISVNMEGCMALRDAYRTRKNVKLSYNDIIAKAIAVAADTYPLVRARYENNEVHIYTHTNVGLAVGLDSALLVPVVKNIDTKSLEEISADYKDVVAKARDGKLKPSEMGCGSITISNLGMFDIDEFVAVVNPPESAILAVGSINVEPRWNGSTFVPVHIMKITGSFDHKFIDGSYGAKFLKELKTLLETPALIF